MRKNSPPTDAAGQQETASGSGARDAGQQIWLAGLGAFARAQEEGGKVFETLVKEGLSIQRKTQAVAEEKLSEATAHMTSMATDLQNRAGHPFDKLENIFEERVAKALDRLAYPSAAELQSLVARMDALEKTTAKGAVTARFAPAKPSTRASAAARSSSTGKRASPRKTGS
ncbi:MAG: phasin family protein [Polaromonas sp.]|nr:phasin family protein [Polaromonas sp.]